MAGSVDEGGPPESWEVADVDAAMSRLMMTSSSSSKLESNNNNNKNSSSSSSSPDLSSSEDDVNSSVDQFLREALQNPRERLSVLRIEQDVEKFVRDPSQQQMEFQQLPTSYLRLAAHRVAQHYSLQSTVLLDNNLPDGSGSRIIVFKTSECRLPLIRLADIPIKLPSDDSGNSVVKVAIKQRPNKRSQLGGGNLNSQRSNSLKSVEERKEEYNRARARIFSPNSSSSVKQESDQRIQEVVQRSSVGASKAEEVSSSTRVDVNSGRGSVDSSTGGSRPGRSRIEEPIGRSNSNNGRVAIFRDREVERNDPDYDRSYDRHVSLFLNLDLQYIILSLLPGTFLSYFAKRVKTGIDLVQVEPGWAGSGLTRNTLSKLCSF
ncbi:R3H domain, SUZ domain protein [Artemisia annua]|uniref:R3H domain, SUZ domain protein n=1 Tax=Artemisia annua TaxID=35608 RepID=A0A2U1NIF9_ARTAN|nr:R3H domain, SUZ domain protein [Artemisia annua]